VMHLAAAANCPVVAIFGPSNAKAWGPWRPSGERVAPALVLTGRCPTGGPCLYRGHSLGPREGCAERQCLDSISPEQVTDAVRGLAAAHVI
jgi:ADP-heptose:LPS heptosyltransferase